MRFWTIYERPREHPEHYAVREWNAHPARGVTYGRAVLCETLEEARATCRGMRGVGAVNLGRYADDDPCIVETWA